jgi:hypothetical protein
MQLVAPIAGPSPERRAENAKGGSKSVFSAEIRAQVAEKLLNVLCDYP